MKRKILFIIAATMLLFGCKKYTDLSAIKLEITNENFSVTGTTATLTADYSWPWKVVSIAMDVSEDEGFANANSFEASVSGNSLTVTANGLKAETTYYYRMRLNMEDGKVESEKKTFKTTEYIFPTVTTSEVDYISATTAKCGGEVTEGDLTVTARGVCWNTTDNPTVADSHTVDGGGAGSFISNITGLTGSTTYYVRSYATSSAGTVYGVTRTFVTTEYILPTVTTSNVNNITSTTAKCGGEVTEGDLTVTARGVGWDTTDNPTVADSHTVDGGGAGSFTSNITGLTENTKYYVRAYAISSAGTAYGETKTFETFKTILSLTVNGVSFEMVYVEGGTFDMGATSEQGSDAYDDEYPVHSVTLSDYYIGRCEVTQELWEAVMGSNLSWFKGAQNPVESVRGAFCQGFINKLNSLTGRTFRLPTEAEWEYAARGGNKSRHYKYSGSDNIDDVAWHYGNSGGETHEVGTKTANELGIYDMSGNVWEWCSDRYGGYSAGSQTNPQGPSSGMDLVLRGGSWDNDARVCRVSNRGRYDPYISRRYDGFRLVLVP